MKVRIINPKIFHALKVTGIRNFTEIIKSQIKLATVFHSKIFNSVKTEMSTGYTWQLLGCHSYNKRLSCLCQISTVSTLLDNFISCPQCRYMAVTQIARYVTDPAGAEWLMWSTQPPSRHVAGASSLLASPAFQGFRGVNLFLMRVC